MKNITWNFKSEDKLIVENFQESVKKNEKIQKGIEAIKDLGFRSSLLSFNKWSNGNFQTCYVVLKDIYRQNFQKEFQYDFREEFEFKDGGKIYLDYKGQGFNLNKKQDEYKPVVFLCIGLASHSKTGFVLDIVEHLIDDKTDSGVSFDVVVINWRGLSGMKLQTPTFYCGSSTCDLIEPMEYIYDKFCKPFNRKAFAVGCSMGGNVLVNSLGILGSQSFIEAACVISVPIKMWEVEDHIQVSANGLYNRSFGNTLRKIILDNKEVLKKNQNINIQELENLENMKETTFIHMDDNIIGPLFGFKNGNEMHHAVSCYHSIPKLKVPTLFINSKDDPVIGEKSIDYDVFKNSEFAILATTKTGGHLGYHQSIFQQQVWVSDPVIKFLNAFR